MLLTAQQFADELQVSAATVRRWVRRGQVVAHRLPGGLIRIHVDEKHRILSTPGVSGPTPPGAAAGVDSPPGVRGSGGSCEQSTAVTCPPGDGPPHGCTASDAAAPLGSPADDPVAVGGCSALSNN